MPYKDYKNNPKAMAYRKGYAAKNKPWQSEAQKDARRKYRETVKGRIANGNCYRKYAINHRENINERSRRYTEVLANNYVRKRILTRSKINPNDLKPLLTEIKKGHLILFRQIKEYKNAKK